MFHLSKYKRQEAPMPCPILSPKEYLCPNMIPFARVRMEALDSQLHAVRVLTLQYLLLFFFFSLFFSFSPHMLFLQRHVFDWKPVL